MSDNDFLGSVFSHKVGLYDCVCKGDLTVNVLDALLPEGEPLEYERQLWDYKLDLPVLSKGGKPTTAELEEFNGAFAEILKDAVAFYNSYGGYIVAGVANSPRIVVGVEGDFDCDELNKRLHASTGKSIECFYKVFDRTSGNGSKCRVGLLFIPQRPDAATPAQFNKDSPLKKSGKKPYNRHDIYFRNADQCIKAESSDHFAFLFTPGRRVLEEHRLTFSPILDSNLGPRDPGFVQFVGRDAYLSVLWQWFLDRFNPVKLLAGIGGVGKTAIAREFAEQIARAAPFGFQKVVWLSAKRQYYTAVSGSYVPAARVDFSSVEELLKEICFELGMLESDFEDDSCREDLMQSSISALTAFPALVIVDDLDSLAPEQQQDVFHTLIAIFGQTVGKSAVGSRAILTARLDLGAAPGQIARVKGLEFQEFVDFVEMTSNLLEICLPCDKASKRMERFHRVTEGSPTFASSVLRLILLGETLDHALTKWEKADGEDVRKFAFKKELDQLPDSATNVLFALCLLGESTLVELAQITTRSDQQVRDDFAELRKYHLINHVESHLPGGTRIAVPGSIRMMKEILKSKVRDSKRIETACAKARSGLSKLGKDIGMQITRIVALWANDQANDAFDLANILHKQHPSDSDVCCLLGRAYLRLTPPNYKQAEINFRKAEELGCSRPELVPLWAETKGNLGDWVGLLDITKYAEKSMPGAEILVARMSAHKNIAEMARRVGDLRSAAERYRDGGLEIDRLFRSRKASGVVVELKQVRKEFLLEYLSLIDKDTKDPDRYIDVWIAAIVCFDAFVRIPSVLRLGVKRLIDWWGAVERRDVAQQSTAGAMNAQLVKFREILRVLRAQENPDEAFVHELENVVSDLDARLSRYMG